MEGHPVTEQRLKEMLGHTPVQVCSYTGNLPPLKGLLWRASCLLHLFIAANCVVMSRHKRHCIPVMHRERVLGLQCHGFASKTDGSAAQSVTRQ